MDIAEVGTVMDYGHVKTVNLQYAIDNDSFIGQTIPTLQIST